MYKVEGGMKQVIWGGMERILSLPSLDNWRSLEDAELANAGDAKFLWEAAGVERAFPFAFFPLLLFSRLSKGKAQCWLPCSLPSKISDIYH